MNIIFQSIIIGHYCGHRKGEITDAKIDIKPKIKNRIDEKRNFHQ